MSDLFVFFFLPFLVFLRIFVVVLLLFRLFVCLVMRRAAWHTLLVVDWIRNDATALSVQTKRCAGAKKREEKKE